ncbi:MAG: glycosyltransferase [Prevotella sp.]|nr:glycosyltransferase [Bacteroides sp.]MCM1366182.1 glycosyltransferase [Prevotella sp.]MCM1436934.1 glycosyltransferase [Prevotella sp.]
MIQYLNIEIIALLIVMLLFAVAGACCAMRPLRRLGKYAAEDAEREVQSPIQEKDEKKTERSADCYVLEEDDDNEQAEHVKARIDSGLLPSLSVIVYAIGNEERLDAYLRQLMQQNYGEFEVIVVFDGGSEAASDMADIFMSRYSNLRLTFVPPNSHHLSRRKLAWALGMKSASGDVVLTTTSNCHIPSREWLYEMVVPFANPSVDVVLGDTVYDFKDFTGAGKWYRQFDDVMTTAQWVSRAITGNPYRGDCYNMAFRKHLFFDINGYADTIGKSYGDEEIFVCRISNCNNTSVVISPETLLKLDWGASTERIRVSQKEQQMLARKSLPQGPFLRRGLLSLSTWLTLLCAIVVITVSIMNMLPSFPWPAVVAFVLLTAFWGVGIWSYRKAAKALGAVKLWWGVPIFLLWSPFANCIFRIRHRNAKVMDFIWNGYQ